MRKEFNYITQNLSNNNNDIGEKIPIFTTENILIENDKYKIKFDASIINNYATVKMNLEIIDNTVSNINKWINLTKLCPYENYEVKFAGQSNPMDNYMMNDIVLKITPEGNLTLHSTNSNLSKGIYNIVLIYKTKE